MTKAVPITGRIRRSHQEPGGKIPIARVRRRLENIRDVWDDFQASRDRDAVYAYLKAVFAIVIVTGGGDFLAQTLQQVTKSVAIACGGKVSDDPSIYVVRRMVRNKQRVRPIPCHQSEGVGKVVGDMQLSNEFR
jgi:hypothetical protein